MSERLENTLETREREPFGRNVEIRAYFLRHGPKDVESGRLTEEGATASKEYGERLQPSSSGEKYILKAYTSEIDRAKETAEAIVDNVNTNRKGRTRIKLELGEKEEDVRMSTSALNLPYSEYIKLNRQEEKIGEKTISLHKVAQRVANEIKNFIKISKRLKSDSRADLINITHLPWLAAFIKEATGQELEKEVDLEKKQKIENKIANLGYLEGFELVIKRDGDDVQLSLKIGSNELELTEETIQKILEN